MRRMRPHENCGMDDTALEVVESVQVMPTSDPSYDQRAAAQLEALRRLLEAGRGRFYPSQMN